MVINIYIIFIKKSREIVFLYSENEIDLIILISIIL